MKGLTKRQEEILKYISDYLTEHGYPPSYQEIADAFSIASKNGVVRHLKALIRKGYIDKTDTSARSIRIIDQKYQSSTNMISVPVIGRVAAGFPVLAEENIEDYVAVPRKIIKTEGRYFALRVQGDSMINAGIFDGDLVIVRSANKGNANDIVVALLEDEVTVKRLVSQGSQAYLKAENPEYPDIHPEQEWHIQGKVVGLIRDSIH
jgi:repressor LexA